jgi:hypothetical protein
MESDTLFALAEEIANVLREKQAELGLEHDAEARLRASLAAATFARSAYEAILAGAEESPIARSFLVPARARCDRTEKQLRRRISIFIAEASMHLNDDDLSNVADYVLS